MFNRFTIKSHTLIILSTVYFGFLLNLSFWRFVFEHVAISNFSLGLFCVSLIFFILVPLYLIFNMVILPKIAKPILAVLLLISSATNYLMYKFGIYIDKDMMQNVFETNTREALNLVTGSLILWVFVTGV